MVNYTAVMQQAITENLTITGKQQVVIMERMLNSLENLVTIEYAVKTHAVKKGDLIYGKCN